MIWYAILVTFLFGGLCGVCLCVLFAVHDGNKMKARREVHPSTRTKNPYPSPIDLPRYE